MKKNLSLFLVLGAGLAATAQIKKDAVLLGGQIYYSKFTSTNSGSSIYPVNKSGGLNISVGKAFKENAVWGVNLSYNPSTNSTVYSTGTGGTAVATSKQKRYSGGVFYRRYKQLFKDVYFFADGDLSYTTLHRKETNATSPQSVYTESGGQFSLTPGISYNLFRKFQVEILIPSIFFARYNHTSYDQDQFAIGTGLPNTTLGSLGVGFHFIL